MHKPRVVLFGVGGHGWRSLSSLLLSSNFEIFMFACTVDYGGTQGVWHRLLQLDNHFLSEHLFGEQTKNLPWGDFNKVLCFFATNKFGNFGNLFDFRSDNLETLNSKFELLTDLIGLDSDVESEFRYCLEFSFKYFEKNYEKLEYKSGKKFCLGYLWHDFLLSKLDSLENVVRFYQKRNILPENIRLTYTSDSRQILTAKIGESILIGEEVVDVSSVPISPENLEITELDGNPGTVSDYFLDQLNKADYIVISPGSVANWVPLIKIPKVQNVIREKSISKKLFWVLNPKKSAHEMATPHYYKFLKNFEINPIIIGPKKEIKITPELKKMEIEKVPYEPIYDLNSDGLIEPNSLKDFLKF